MKKIFLAITFGICLCGISNAQPGAAQRAIVDKAIETAKEWRLERAEIGWDRGPVLKGTFERDKGDISCGPQRSGPEKPDRERDIRPEKIDRDRPEKPEKPDRTPPERIGREKAERSGARDKY